MSISEGLKNTLHISLSYCKVICVINQSFFWCLYDTLPIGVNLVKNVSAFETPFAPLGLAMGWINTDYTPFASLRLGKITYQHQREGLFECLSEPGFDQDLTRIYRIRGLEDSQDKRCLLVWIDTVSIPFKREGLSELMEV